MAGIVDHHYIPDPPITDVKFISSMPDRLHVQYRVEWRKDGRHNTKHFIKVEPARRFHSALLIVQAAGLLPD